jgi:hypothetical protein
MPLATLIGVFKQPKPTIKPMAKWILIYQEVKSGIKKALIWYIFNAIFAILPILIIWILMGASNSQELIFLKDKVYYNLMDCAFMFSCTAITGAAMMDFVNSNIRPESNLTFFGIIISAAAVILVVTVLYVNSMTNHQNTDRVNIGLYKGFLVFLVAFTSIYCISLKTYIYSKINEENMGE